MTARRTTAGLATSLAVLSLLLVAPGAQALGRSFWGVVDRSGGSSQDLDKMQRSGAGVARANFLQSEIEPAPGSFDFSSSDQLIGGLASRRIQVLPVLLLSPSNPPPPVDSAGARQQWQQFAHEFVARYKPGGEYWTNPSLYQSQHPGAKPRPVRSFQVFNEPNLKKYFPSNNPVRDYARLLKISHDAIRSAYAHAKVVLAGIPGFTAYRGWKFLDRLYRVNGVKRSFDIAAVHPYSPKLFYLRYQMKRFRKVMARHRDAHTPIWITEIGYGSAHRNGALGLNKGLNGQARALTKAFKFLRGERRRWNLRGVVWFEWRDPEQQNTDCTFCSSAGLLRSNFEPKPAFRAFRRFTR